MTFTHSATTRRWLRSAPTRTPLCWTQPARSSAKRNQDAREGKFMTARHTLTEPAATAAIDQGCRMLRLPTIRDRFAEITTLTSSWPRWRRSSRWTDPDTPVP